MHAVGNESLREKIQRERNGAPESPITLSKLFSGAITISVKKNPFISHWYFSGCKESHSSAPEGPSCRRSLGREACSHGYSKGMGSTRSGMKSCSHWSQWDVCHWLQGKPRFQSAVRFAGVLSYAESRTRKGSWFPAKAVTASAPLLQIAGFSPHIAPCLHSCFQILFLGQKVFEEETGCTVYACCVAPWLEFLDIPTSKITPSIVDYGQCKRMA